MRPALARRVSARISNQARLTNISAIDQHPFNRRISRPVPGVNRLKRIITALALAAGVAATAQAGATKPPALVTQTCAACHGADGNGTSPANPMYPKLAGLRASYLAKQMRDFQSGLRASESMAPWVAGLDADTINELAEYYAAQPHRAEPARRPELIELGRSIYFDGNVDSGVPACAGCHQPDAHGNRRFPMLAGQYADYAHDQMRRFVSGERDNDRGLVMQSVSLRMSDKEMRAVAEYLMTVQ